MSKEADVNCDGDSSADELDNDKSFVKKVKSRVSGFIPSTLSKWFGGTKVRQRDDVEEDDDDAYELQPPMKRVKKLSQENLFDLSINATPTVQSQQHNPFSTNIFREPVPGPSTVRARKLVLPATSNQFSQTQSEQTNGVDSDSGESTSGYSSMPRIGSKEHVAEVPERSSNLQPTLNNTATTTNRSIFNTSLAQERSLFGEHLISPQKSTNTSLSSRRPSFNASAFGTPNFMDKTLSTRRIISSPFYNGRITYGGASAYNRSVFYPSPEQTPQSPSVQPKQVNESRSIALSKTAKRILDTLEQYTSPVQDVRRIPTHRRLQRSDSLIGKYVGANPYLMRDAPKVASNKELQVPTTIDLLKMKERLQESTTTMREIASKSNSPLNVELYSLRPSDDDQQATNKSTNKIKTARRQAVRQKAPVADETVPEVNLPDVRLPISTLPNFNFSIPSAKPVSVAKEVTPNVAQADKAKSSETPTPSSTTPTSTTSKQSVQAPAVNFKSPEVKPSPFASTLPFSKPSIPLVANAQVSKTATTTKLPTPADKPAEFKFSEPLIIADSNLKSIKAINNFKFSKPLVKKAYNGVTLASSETTDSVVKALSRSADLPKETNSDTSIKFGATTLKPATNGPSSLAVPASGVSSWGDKFKPASNTWECSICMVRNDGAKKKCVACENPKPTTVAAPPTQKVADLESFKKKEDEWECSSCMVRNAAVQSKCVCCETAKPSAKKPTSTTPAAAPAATTSSWGDKFKTPSNTWECPMCLVRNDVQKAKCVACENDRPASVVVPKGLDGFKKEGEWECTSCMVRNPNAKQKCVCCEAPKPGEKSSSSTAQVTEVPKFSFGIENGLINGHGFVFGIPADKNAAKKEEKSTEVDGASASSIFGAKKPETTSTQFSFGVKPVNGAKSILSNAVSAGDNPKTDSKPTESTPTFSFGVPAAKKRPAESDSTSEPPLEKKNDSTIVPVKPTTSSEKEKASEPPKFSFGAPAPISTGFSFGTAATGASAKPFSFGAKPSNDDTSNKTDFKSPVVNATTAAPTPATTSATPMKPMFAFGSSANATGTSLKTEAPAAATMFNAGSNNPPAPPTNGPVFSFTSQPKSDTTPVFNATKSTFGNVSAGAFGVGASTAPSFNSIEASKTMPFAPATNVFGGTAAASAAPETTTPAPTFGGNTSTFGNKSATSMFGAPKGDAPTFGASTSTPTFGSSSGGSVFGKLASNGGFSFNASNPTNETKPFAFGSSGSSTEQKAPAFNFTAPGPTPSVSFVFAPTNNSQPSNGGFNFGGSNPTIPTFNADAKPTFNFTAGSSAPTTFSAEPRAAPPRLIRKAVRRTQR